MGANGAKKPASVKPRMPMTLWLSKARVTGSITTATNARHPRMSGPFSGRAATRSSFNAWTGRFTADASRGSFSTDFSFTVTSGLGLAGSSVGKLYGDGGGGSAFRISGGTRTTVLPFLRTASTGVSTRSTAGFSSGGLRVVSTLVPQTGQSGSPSEVHPVPQFRHFTIASLLDPTDFDDPR